jgi:hypothetical protein
MRTDHSDRLNRVVPLAVIGPPCRSGPWAVEDRSAEGAIDLTDRTLGPHWVRVTTVGHGRQRSPTVTSGSEAPQVAGPPAHAAGMMHPRDSDCGPEGRVGDVGAADGQQPVSVTTGEPARRLWRIMTANPAIDGH